MATDPAHFTSPAWAAREARRLALEEAAVTCERKRDDYATAYGKHSADAAAAEACMDAIRALATKDAP